MQDLTTKPCFCSCKQIWFDWYLSSGQRCHPRSCQSAKSTSLHSHTQNKKSLCKDILHTECIFVGIFTGSSMMLKLENFYFSRFQLYSAHNKTVCGLPRVKTFLCSFQKNLSQTVSMAHPQEDVVMWKNLRAETAIDQKSICKNFENWLIVWVFQTKVPK